MILTKRQIEIMRHARAQGSVRINELATDMGVSLETIFRSATLDNARVFGLDDDIGTVEVGKRADLLLMSEDPLESLSAYDSIDLVVLNGQVLDRHSLAATRITGGSP